MSFDSVCCMSGEASISLPMANTLAYLCSFQRWTFWTSLWLFLFSLYLMNFTFHTTLDALGKILRVHYKSMKCDVSFSQGSVSTLFRRGEHVVCVCKNVVSAYSSEKSIRIKRVFPGLWPHCHVSVNHSVCTSCLKVSRISVDFRLRKCFKKNKQIRVQCSKYAVTSARGVCVMRSINFLLSTSRLDINTS